MLQIKNICKEYRTGNLVQQALDDVSLNLRDNEFVAILGPSGSGKTTLLNIIGGLDQYDSGDLIINEISTREYKDRDWDSYRNHTIGFVFQSYNLIPHQTILANVELALTISGISKGERKDKAIQALKEVGLGEQIHKKPNQLSGGQMQRVAIARALVNDPDILLADEPTGALDSDTSIQVMDLLKEVAKNRLVVMVTHNPELAEEYATRIVRLKDGKIRADSNPYEMDAQMEVAAEHKNMGKTSMSFLTSLALSFNNLKTKKGRTILTAFAGSIGIIGIALILSLSNGVNQYIADIEEETLSEYPLQIQNSGLDMTAMLTDSTAGDMDQEKGDIQVGNMLTGMFSTVGTNDLKSLKTYLDSGETKIKDYVNAIEYDYNVAPQIYSADTEEVRQVHPDQSFRAMGLGSAESTNSMMSAMMSTDVFGKLPEHENLYKDQYEVKAGHWPKNRNECVLVLTANGNIGDFLLYTLGLRDFEELDQMVTQFTKEEEVTIPQIHDSYDYEDILGTRFKLVAATDYYEYNKEYDLWKDKRDDKAYMKNLIQNGENLEIVGIVQPRKDANAAMLSSGIYYPSELVEYVSESAKNSEIVKAQQSDHSRNVFTGKGFDAKDDSENAFQMESLFRIDGQKVQSAFSVDGSKLNLDLSGINAALGSLSLPPLNIEEILGQLQIQISGEQIQTLVMDLMNGYQEYAAAHPEVDISQFPVYFQEYMKNGGADILREAIRNALIENNGEPITEVQVQAILQEVLDGYNRYAQENHLPDIGKFQEYFAGYLESEQAREVLEKSMTEFVQSNNLSEKISAVMAEYMQMVAGSVSYTLERELTASMMQLAAAMQDAISFDADVFASAIQMNMTEQELAELMASMMSKEIYTYDGNLALLGYADKSNPSQISLYPKDFERKEEVVKILDSYNARMENEDEEKVISYTDVVGSLMASITTIVNLISYVLIAFVAISLVVSSIMIGVITYISVLERKKEIGILRAIGASKKNVSQVFNAETFIIGALAGLIGIGATVLLLFPANSIIHTLAGNDRMNAALPPVGALILIALSIVLTLIGGILPSRKAAKEDPVTALRTE
ncbi:MAG: ABC transporter ATP-binding protein/permease [[Ruminococcus] gnavus]|nr:ABC transporter ATP-binding protein/permease [Mediterraneibacter gnavus]